MFKFKVSDATIKDAAEKVRAQVNAVLAQPRTLNEIGSFLTERVQFQARTAKPLNQGASFPGLAPATVKQRAYLLKYNEGHPTAKAQRSNLTITGNFLNSLKHSIIGTGLVQLMFTGEHPRYRGKSGLIGKEISNETLRGYLKEKGFEPFDQAIQTNKIITARINAIVRKALRLSLRK